MGQYYLTVNLDKREYLDPHKFGDGLKLLEFGTSGSGTMTGLAILLADGNGRGGGDLHSEHPIIGTWAGDRIVITGDYADEGKFLDGLELKKPKEHTLYDMARAQSQFTDISEKVIEAMCDDQWLADVLRKPWGKA